MRIATLLLLLPLCNTQLCAQAGTLELDFSTDGLHAWDLSANDDQLTAVAVQPDGKIIGTGWVTDGNTANIVVQRLLPDGTPDPGFGIGGVVYTNAIDDFHYAYAVAVQSTGNIVVAGLAYDLGSDGNALLLRYLPDGTLDATFGTGGILSTDLGGGPGFQAAYALRIMDDDRIVIVGQEDENGVMCARFSADGIPDTTYGVAGLAVSGIAGTGLCMHLYDDGSVMAGGYALPGGYPDWMLARFDPDGVLDTAFAFSGISTTDLGGSGAETIKSLSVLPDGRIAACGFRNFQGQDDEPIVTLYDTDGNLDVSFGLAGRLILPFGAPQWGQATAIIAGPDNKLLVAGFRAQPGGVANNDFFLFRILLDGDFDQTFAGGGQVFTDVTGSYDRAHAMALAPDGDIVLGGYGFITERATAYARYVNDINMGLQGHTSSTNGLNIFPLPAQDHVFVEYISNNPGHVMSTLFSSDGRRVLSNEHGWQAAGAQRLKLDLPHGLPAGMYMVEVAIGDHVKRARIVVANAGR